MDGSGIRLGWDNSDRGFLWYIPFVVRYENDLERVLERFFGGRSAFLQSVQIRVSPLSLDLERHPPFLLDRGSLKGVVDVQDVGDHLVLGEELVGAVVTLVPHAEQMVLGHVHREQVTVVARKRTMDTAQRHSHDKSRKKTEKLQAGKNGVLKWKGTGRPMLS